MDTKLRGYELESIIDARLSALAEFNKALRRVEVDGIRICEALTAGVPESLRQFVEDEGVLGAVWNHGRYATNIVYDRYGFDGYVAAKKAADELKEAWAGQIVVNIGEDLEPDRVDIRFSVARFDHSPPQP